MSDVVISYARSTEREARLIDEALQSLGYSVWRDDRLPAHRDYSDVIEERVRAAKAVVVVWSAEAAKSQWVRAEADMAREAGTLVQLTLDRAALPLPFNRIQCADMAGWSGDLDAPGWRKVVTSVAELLGAGPAPRPAADRPLPDKPSIAVLPFSDPAGGADGDGFADGVVHEITAALGRFRSLFVIDAGSSLAYRGSGKSPKEIAHELGVRYVLEGSVQRAGQRLRISVQLADTIEGIQVLGRRFDGTFEDVFALQDDVAAAVAGQIEPTISAAEARRAARRPPSDLTAYQLWAQAYALFRRLTADNMDTAISLLERAIAIDPTYGRALAALAHVIANQLADGSAADAEAGRERAVAYCDRALRAEPDDPEVLARISLTYWALAHDPAAAGALARRALELNPNLSIGWYASAAAHIALGAYEQAIAAFRHYRQLDPNSVATGALLASTGGCLVGLGRFDEALEPIREGLELSPGNPWGLIYRATAYVNLGRMDEARQTLAAIDPRQRRSVANRTLGPGLNARIEDALKQLGVDV